MDSQGKKEKDSCFKQDMSCFLCQCKRVFLKKDSIKQLIQERSPDIVLLTETKVNTKVSIKIDGYQVFPAVKKRQWRGLAVAVKHGLCFSLVIHYGENAEFITVRLRFGLESVRLILAYGPQEGVLRTRLRIFIRIFRYK